MANKLSYHQNNSSSSMATFQYGAIHLAATRTHHEHRRKFFFVGDDTFHNCSVVAQLYISCSLGSCASVWICPVENGAHSSVREVVLRRRLQQKCGVWRRFVTSKGPTFSFSLSQRTKALASNVLKKQIVGYSLCRQCQFVSTSYPQKKVFKKSHHNL